MRTVNVVKIAVTAGFIGLASLAGSTAAMAAVTPQGVVHLSAASGQPGTMPAEGLRQVMPQG